MKVKSMIKNPNGLKTVYHSYRDALLSSVRCFRTGEDSIGMDCFLNSMKELEKLQEVGEYSNNPEEKIKKIIPILQTLLECMHNQDIVGMTDILEFELVPLSEEWDAECDRINAGENDVK